MDRKPESLSALKTQIERGEYAVDPGCVADAMLRRLRTLADARTEHVEGVARTQARSLAAHPMWSNPESSTEPSVKTAPGSSAAAWPIQLRGIVSFRSLSSRSALWRAPGGRHTQSS